MLSAAAEHRLLRLLERAGPQGLTVREFVPLYWAGRDFVKKPGLRSVGGRMLCAMVDLGYASRVGTHNCAIHVLQEAGKRRLAEIAALEAEQARRAAARVEREREPEGQGPWF